MIYYRNVIMWAKQYIIQFHKNSPRFFFPPFFFFFLNRASIGMWEGEVPDPGLRLKSPLSVPAYCPTRLKLLYDYFDAPGLLVSALLWCVSQLFLRHYWCCLFSLPYTYTFIYFKRQPSEIFAATVTFPADSACLSSYDSLYN